MPLAEALDTERLILEHQDLADQAAACYRGRCNATEQEEIRSDAYVGLVQAARDFDPQKNNNFQAYARQRIRYAIQDGFRQRDHLSRSYRKKIESNPIRILSLRENEQGGPLSEEDSNLAHVEQVDTVRHLLQGLPLSLRRAVYLRFWRGMKIHEIALRLKVTPQTAGHRIRTALHRMKLRAVTL